MGSAESFIPPVQIGIQPEANHRERRNISRPKHLDDFEVKLPPSVDHAPPTHNQWSSTVHNLANFISYDKFIDSHKVFFQLLKLIRNPRILKNP